MRGHVASACIVIAFCAVVFVGVAARMAHSGPAHRTLRVTFQGKNVMWWAHHAVAARRDANALRTVVRRQRAGFVRDVEPVYEHAATIAATVYGVDAGTLIRKGRCESVNWTQFHNDSGASGPWQFLPSTWASTPFASFSSYDPLAAALAAAWMHAHGRGGEWVCQ